MKFRREPTENHLIVAHGDDFITVGQTRYRESLLLVPDQPPQRIDATNIELLQTTQFPGVIAMKPQLFLLGSGRVQRFLDPALLAGFYAAQIGVETMDTPAACRTYNLLAAEGRRLAAIIILEPLETS